MIHSGFHSHWWDQLSRTSLLHTPYICCWGLPVLEYISVKIEENLKSLRYIFLILNVEIELGLVSYKCISDVARQIKFWTTVGSVLSIQLKFFHAAYLVHYISKLFETGFSLIRHSPYPMYTFSPPYTSHTVLQQLSAETQPRPGAHHEDFSHSSRTSRMIISPFTKITRSTSPNSPSHSSAALFLIHS